MPAGSEAFAGFSDGHHVTLQHTCTSLPRGLTCAVRRACDSFKKAEAIMARMRNQGVKPNVVTYTALIRICGQSGDVDQALVKRLQ